MICVDDVPLPRAGVLRLVDQHVIDAAVELVVHPAGRAAVQHRQRLVDQIVIIEQAAFLLLAPVVRRHRGRDMQQGFGAVAGGERAAAFDQGFEPAGLRVEPLRRSGAWRRRTSWSPPICAACWPRSGTRSRYSSTCAMPAARSASRSRSAWSWSALLLAPRMRGDLFPARSRQVRPVDDLALDVFDAVAGIDAERSRHLRGRCVGAAGAVGPGHEMIAAETGLAHDVLEGDVGRAGHRDRSARPVALSGSREASSITARLARSIISVWSRSSSTAKRAGTLASNGNCCSSRVHSAWMVCTFSPPGVSSAEANSSRARIAQARSRRARCRRRGSRHRARRRRA